MHPSGAASIEWFDKWIKTGDPDLKQRILDYNDCRATRVLLDGIRGLEMSGAVSPYLDPQIMSVANTGASYLYHPHRRQCFLNRIRAWTHKRAATGGYRRACRIGSRCADTA